MEVSSLFPMLGHCISSLSVRAAFQVLGINLVSEISLPEDEYRTYIERRTDGTSFVFTDEAMFLGLSSQSIGSGPLFFSNIFFYAWGTDGYTEYPYSLPYGIFFSDKQSDLKSKLGVPEWDRTRDDGSIIAERWTMANKFKLHVTYSKTGTIKIVSYGIPDRAS
jgi:hypothetical protein